MKNRMKRAATSVLLLLLMAATSAFAADGKFRSSATTTSATSRYVVALNDMAADDPSTIATSLAASYGGRLEPYAAEGFRGFAIVMTPARARLLSADPRVEWVEEQSASVLPPATAAKNLTPATDATAISWTTGAYSYDGAGNITSIGPGTGSVTQTYQYDAVGRLATGTANTTAQNNAQTYRYDRYGNLTEIVTTAGVVAPATAKLAVDPTSNQLTKVSDCDPHGPPCYTATYDQAGNVLTSSAGSLHTWDDLGMMTRFQGGTRDELYVYDASNERIAVVRLATNGAETTREYALRGLDGKVLREVVRDAATPLELHWKRDNIFSGSSLIASIVDDGTGTPKRRHHHADHLGTPRLITDDAGFVLARHTYWPYGEDAPTTEIGSERMKFTAHERDLDTTPGRELDYMHARFYSPSRGRFLSVDPGGWDRQRPQSWNRYNYVLNGPVTLTDPTGRCVWDICVGEATAAAAVLTTATVYVLAPSSVPGKSNGDVMVQSAANGLKAVGRWLLNGNTGGGDQMAAQTHVQNWANTVQKEQDAETVQKDPKRRFSKGDRQEGLDKSKDDTGTPRCEYCGNELKPSSGSGNSYEADHRTPHAQGGRTTQENLAPSCRDCNREKGNRTPAQWEKDKEKERQ